MYLIRLGENDSLSLVEFEEEIPAYAILSHTWASKGDEVTFDDFTGARNHEKPGWDKIRFCAAQAKKDNLLYFWVDTCCIDCKSSSELGTAINSMYRWYQNAQRCYVYLKDVGTISSADDGMEKRWKPEFRKSRWFTRGWTLQELIAPRSVEFFSSDGVRLGSKRSLEGTISDITGIPAPVLCGDPLSNYDILIRMSWGSNRHTKREEDGAYCLLGLCGVTMPLVYGEGLHRAKRRLLIETGNDPEALLPGITKTNRLDYASKLRLQSSLGFSHIDARRTMIAAAHIRTCEWFLASASYVRWRDDAQMLDHHGFLWIKGKPGSGKSTLMKFALTHTQKTMTSTVVLSFFFSARGTDPLEKSTTGLYRALLTQILAYRPDLIDIFNELPIFRSEKLLGGEEWDLETLKSLLLTAVTYIGRAPLVCFIDALDEVQERQIRDMITFFNELGAVALNRDVQFRVCFASRYYPHITIGHGLELRLEQEVGHDEDISGFISSELRIGNGKTAVELKKAMQNKASGVFMWIVLVVAILNREYDRGRVWALRRRLEELPGDLNALFCDMLTRDSHSRDELTLCLQFILYSEKALSPEQLYYGILAESDLEANDREMTRHVPHSAIERFVHDVSKGLVEIAKSGQPRVQFIHESVKDFLVKENGMQIISEAPRNNLVGESHDRLKRCCLRQLEAWPWERRALPKLQRPWADYAVETVLYHANMASRHGIKQTDFLASFSSQSLCQKTGPQSLLYILGTQNREALIADSPQKLECFVPEPTANKYGIPLFAALGCGSKEAVIAFVHAHAENLPASDPLKESCRSYSKKPCRGGSGNLQCSNPRPATILLQLADYGDDVLFALAVRILDCTVDIMDPQTGYSPLITAVLHRNALMVQTILNSTEYSVNYRDTGLGRTPLIWAVEEGIESIVRLIIGHDRTDVNAKDGRYGRCPLSWAAQSGRIGIVTALLEVGKIDVSSTDRDGRTALSWAADYGHEDVCRSLLGVGQATKHLLDHKGRSPRDWAALSNQHRVVTMLS